MARVSSLLVLLLLAAGLGGCFTHRSMAPLPQETRLELARAGFSEGAALLVRIFKQENELEVWLRTGSGRYRRFRTYPICSRSGTLGPKLKEGDGQAPEGFYVVNARQMNPNSRYYLSFNLGFPNAYDRSWGRTGSYLMVHGGCRSAGCYAITDDAIQELFTLARLAFEHGQRQFPVHAFPFRMTAANLAAHANSPWAGFWANLKEGADMFDKTGVPPVVGIDRGRYVFFANPQSVPEAFRLKVLAADGKRTAFIAGWGDDGFTSSLPQ